MIETLLTFSTSLDHWLPDNHLARFVAGIVDDLDMSALEGVYAPNGSDATHSMMTFYSCVTGMPPAHFPSEKWNWPLMSRTFALCGGQATSGQ